jgi:putative restriction endonuclease
MRLRVAVTDNDWFRYLRGLSDVDEVNFWKPGGKQTFAALAPNEPLLFKLHHPENYIVGGGFFVRFVLLPWSYVWESFGQKNGAATQEEMRRRIEKYRRERIGPGDTIGCILLRAPFFFDESLWIPSPPDFALNIVQGKSYDTETPAGRRLWDEVTARLQAMAPLASVASQDIPRIYGDPVLVRPRLGQGTFRLLVTDNYQRRCAVTGEKALPTLDAAHIRPVAEGGQHLLDNGLLLRTDVHRLYDSGYVTVTPDGRFLVSRRLKDDFDNGEPYMPFHGQRIWMPGDPVSQPNREALEWHSEAVFLR